MKATEFKYKCFTFVPEKRVNLSFSKLIKHTYGGDLTPKGWNYDEFYDIAEKHHCKTFDIFSIKELQNKILVIPSTDVLYKWKDEER